MFILSKTNSVSNNKKKNIPKFIRYAITTDYMWKTEIEMGVVGVHPVEFLRTFNWLMKNISIINICILFSSPNIRLQAKIWQFCFVLSFGSGSSVLDSDLIESHRKLFWQDSFGFELSLNEFFIPEKLNCLNLELYRSWKPLFEM